MKKAYLFAGKINEELFDKLNILPIFFPQSWVKVLKNNAGDYKKNMKLYALSDKIKIMHPGVVSYDLSEKSINGKTPWLYVIDNKEKISSLEIFSKQWLLSQIKKLKLKISTKELNSIMNEKLEYGNPIDFSEKNKNPKIIEGIAIYLFCKKKHTFSLEQQNKQKKLSNKERKMDIKIELEFFPSFSNRFYEAISEPINLDGDFLSLVITSTYATDPITKEKRLILQPSFRRWMFGGKEGLYLKGNHSLYLLNKNNQNKFFSKFTIQFKKGKVNLKSDESALFKRLSRNKINLKKFCENPKKYIDSEEFYIGVPYGDSSFGGGHKIGSGVEQSLRKSFYDLLAFSLEFIETLKPFELEQYTPKQNSQFLKFYISSNKESPRRKFDFNFAEYKGESENIFLNIWVDNFDELEEIPSEKNIKKYLIDVIDESMINFEKISDSFYVINTKNNKKINLFINFINNENLNRKISKNESENQRINEILNLLKKNSIQKNSFSLIEMKDYSLDEEKSEEEKDPKELIKKTFSSFEIKTQFIQPMEEDKENKNLIRMEKSLLDIFSKSGFVISTGEHTANIYGFDIFSFKNKEKEKEKNKEKEKLVLPILSRITKDSKMFNFLDGKGWVSEENVLSKLNNLEYQKGFNWEMIERKIAIILKKDVENKILVFPANLRWKFIEELRNDIFSEKINLLNEVKDLAICRFSNTYNKDVPGYFLLDEKKKETIKTSGIIQIHDSLFYSVGKKPDTDKVGKFSNHFNFKKAKFQQRILIEFVIVSNNSKIEKKEIAAILHDDRALSLTSNFHLNKVHSLYMIDNLNEFI